MNYESEISALEAEWSPEDGFFWKVRQGHFDPQEFERVLGLISKIRVEEEGNLPRRIVSLLWYIPLFMQWQVARVQEGESDQGYLGAVDRMTDAIEELLGVP